MSDHSPENDDSKSLKLYFVSSVNNAYLFVRVIAPAYTMYVTFNAMKPFCTKYQFFANIFGDNLESVLTADVGPSLSIVITDIGSGEKIYLRQNFTSAFVFEDSKKNQLGKIVSDSLLNDSSWSLENDAGAMARIKPSQEKIRNLSPQRNIVTEEYCVSINRQCLLDTRLLFGFIVLKLFLKKLRLFDTTP